MTINEILSKKNIAFYNERLGKYKEIDAPKNAIQLFEENRWDLIYGRLKYEF